MSVEKEVFPFMARDKELYAMELQGTFNDPFVLVLSIIKGASLKVQNNIRQVFLLSSFTNFTEELHLDSTVNIGEA